MGALQLTFDGMTEQYGKREQFLKDLKSGVFVDMIREEIINEHFQNSKEVYNTLKPMVATHSDVEKLYVIFLNARNGVIDIVPMFSGSISASSIYPRELIKSVIEKKAVSVILAHNHPSGDCKPSPEDILITRKIQFGLSFIDVSLHDHIIIGSNGEYFSFGDNIIPDFKKEISVFLREY